MGYKLKYIAKEETEVRHILDEISELHEIITRRRKRLRELGDKAKARMTEAELKTMYASAAKKGAATRRKNQAAKKARK